MIISVKNKIERYILLALMLNVIFFTFFRLCYGFEVNKIFADQSLKLNTRINFALDLALKKYDGQRIWVIYSIDGYWTTNESRMIQGSIKENQTLEQIIFEKTFNKGSSWTEQAISNPIESSVPNKLIQITSNKRVATQMDNKRRSDTKKIAIILDYSLESGNPCLYQIYLQRMNQPFSRENRSIFWLGEEVTSISVNWLNDQFYHTKYLKLKQQIIASIGTHNCSKQAIEFMKKIVWGNYSLLLKNEAIYWLSQHNSIESIKILAILAVKQTDIRLKKKAIFALSQIRDKKATTIVSVLAKQKKNRGIRQEAIFWLSQIADEDAIEVLNEILTSENDHAIKDYTIFAISQLPEMKATPILYQIAQNSPDSRIRKKAMFWLHRTRDQRMMDFFMDLVHEEEQRGSN